MHLELNNLESGFKIGNYEIIDKIGKGGHAIVYRAVQINLQRNVALKVVSTEFSANNEFVSMFIREAQSIAKLTHPNIIHIYDAGTTEDGISYLAMELVEGGDLQEIIDKQTPLTLDKIIEIAVKISDALNYGYKKMQLIHSDIKPANIMIDFNGNPRIADFGLAETFFHCDTRDSSHVYGTPYYISPEAISGTQMPGDCQPDIYSFGCMMYHLIIGEPPYNAKNIKELLFQHLKATPPKLIDTLPDIPLPLSELITSMMSKKAYDRPKSWDDINKTMNDILVKMEHPLKFACKKHWKFAFEYSEKEMTIVFFIFASILLLIQPWLGSTLLFFITIAHYLIHSQKKKI